MTATDDSTKPPRRPWRRPTPFASLPAPPAAPPPLPDPPTLVHAHQAESARARHAELAARRAALAADPDPRWQDLADLDLALGDASSALAAYEKAKQATPDRPEPHLGAARARLLAAALPPARSARPALRRVVREMAALARRTPAVRRAADLLRLDALERLGRHDRAARVCEALLAREPEDAEVLRRLAEARLLAREPECALTAYRLAVAQAPADVAAWVGFGLLVRAHGTAAAALGVFAEALRRNPDAWAPSYELGRLWARNGESAHAAWALRRAYKTCPHATARAAIEAALEPLRAGGAVTEPIGSSLELEGLALAHAAGSLAHAAGSLAQPAGLGGHAGASLAQPAAPTSHAAGSLAHAGGSLEQAGGSLAQPGAPTSHAAGSLARAAGSLAQPAGLGAHAGASLAQPAAPTSHAAGSLAHAGGSLAHAGGSLAQPAAPTSHAGGSLAQPAGLGAQAVGSLAQPAGLGAHAGGSLAHAGGSLAQPAGSMPHAGAALAEPVGPGALAGGALALSGAVLGRPGAVVAGLGALERAVALEPGSARVALGAARVARMAGARERGAELARRAAELEPGRAGVQVLLARVLLEEGDARGAMQACAGAAAHAADAAEGLRLGALALERLGRVDEAAAAWARYAGAYPGDARGWRERARLALAPGQREGGIAACREAARAGVDDADVYHNLGALLLGEGRAREAAMAFGRALELAPERAETEAARGLALARAGMEEEAAGAFERAVALDVAVAERGDGPDLAELLADADWVVAFGLGELRRAAGDARGAAVAFEAAARAAGGAAWQPLAAAVAAWCAATPGRAPARALRLARRVYRKFPAVPEAALALVEALERAGRDTEAAAIARAATAGLVGETMASPDPAALPWELAGMVARARASTGPPGFEAPIDALTDLALRVAELATGPDRVAPGQDPAAVAWTWLIAAVVRAPGLAASWRVAGRVLDRLGRHEAAWRALSVAGALEPSDAGVAEELARHHAAQGAFARARRALARSGRHALVAETTQPLSAVAAWVELQAGQPAAALAHLAPCDPRDPAVRTLTALARRDGAAFERLAARAPDPDHRAALLANAGAARPGTAAELRAYERALALDPTLSAALVNAARALVERGNAPAARALLASLPPAAAASELALAGATSLKLGELEAARSALAHAATRAPGNPRFGFALAHILSRQGAAAAARELLEMLGRSSDTVASELALARLARETAPPGAALHAERAHLDAALQSAPTDLRARVARAALHLAESDPAAARALLEPPRAPRPLTPPPALANPAPPNHDANPRPDLPPPATAAAPAQTGSNLAQPAPPLAHNSPPRSDLPQLATEAAPRAAAVGAAEGAAAASHAAAPRVVRAAAAHNLALACLALGDAGGARRAVRRAVRLAPANVAVLVLDALVALAVGELRRARRSVGAAERVRPGVAVVGALGVVLDLLRGRAARAFARARRLPEPLRARVEGRGQPAGLVNAALVLLAREPVSAASGAAAAPLLIQAITGGLARPEVFLWLERALRAAGDASGAEAALEAGRELNPGSQALRAERAAHLGIRAGRNHYGAKGSRLRARAWVDWGAVLDALFALPDDAGVDAR